MMLWNWRRAGVAMAAGLMALAGAAAHGAPAADPALSGRWLTVAQGSGDDGRRELNMVDLTALKRDGDVVTGRVAYVGNKLHSGKYPYLFRITVARVNCKARTRQPVRVTAYDGDAKLLISVDADANAAWEPLGDSIGARSMADAFCNPPSLSMAGGYADVPEAARNVYFQTGGDGSPIGNFAFNPNARALAEAALPPAQGDWRPVDEQIGRTLLFETTSLWREGALASGWVAIALQNPRSEGKTTYVLSAFSFSIDCREDPVTSHGVILMDAAGKALAPAHHPASSDDVFNDNDGTTIWEIACAPGLLNRATGFKTLADYRARHWGSRR